MKKQKNYKKNWGATYQVRLSKEEKKEWTSWINRFGTTHREVFLTIMNYLKDETVIKNGLFYTDLKQYAYSRGGYKLNNPDKCSLCNDKYRYKSSDTIILGHHHDGYDDDNIDNVKWVCRRCHGFVHRQENKALPWEEIVKLHKNWNGRRRDEESFFEEYGFYEDEAKLESLMK